MKLILTFLSKDGQTWEVLGGHCFHAKHPLPGALLVWGRKQSTLHSCSYPFLVFFFSPQSNPCYFPSWSLNHWRPSGCCIAFARTYFCALFLAFHRLFLTLSWLCLLVPGTGLVFWPYWLLKPCNCVNPSKK